MQKYDPWLKCAFLTMMGVAFFMLHYYSPLRYDDYYYQFFIEPIYPISLSNPSDWTDWTMTTWDVNRPIRTLSDAFWSQVNHYGYINGRFTNHFLVQSFIGVWGKPLFNVCSALVFLFFLVGTVRLVRLGRATSVADYVVIVAAWWLLQPQIAAMYNGVAFSVNYLWAGTLCVWFLLLVLKQQQHPTRCSGWRLLLLLLFAILTGSTHEGFTIPMSGALFLLALWRRGRLGRTLWVLTVGLWMGTAIVALAPGTLTRGTDGWASLDWDLFLRSKLEIVRYSKRFYLMVALLLVHWVTVGWQRTVAFVRGNGLLLTIIAVNFAFITVVFQYIQRMEFLIEYLSIGISLRLVYELLLSKQFYRYLCPQLLLVLVIHVALTVNYSRQYNDAFRQMLNAYQSSADGTVHYKAPSLPPGFRSRFYPVNVFEQKVISQAYGKRMKIMPDSQ